MKYFFLFILLVASPRLVEAQEQEVLVDVKIDKDTVLAGEVVRISFEVSGGSILEFTPPEFTGFQIIAGPNVSSSFSMINGKVDQSCLLYTSPSPRDRG